MRENNECERIQFLIERSLERTKNFFEFYEKKIARREARKAQRRQFYQVGKKEIFRQARKDAEGDGRRT